MRPAVREKKSLCDSESLPVVQQQTHIRPISWSKPIRNSEGRNPLWLAVVQIFLYVCKFENACAAAVRQGEVSSRDARSVDPLATFFSQKSD